MKIANREFTSRLLLGTGKFAANELMRDAIAATKDFQAVTGKIIDSHVQGAHARDAAERAAEVAAEKAEKKGE